MIKNLNFIILSPSLEFGLLNSTISSIKRNYPDSKFLCVYLESNDLTKIKGICPSLYKANDGLVSMVNLGMKQTKGDWNIFVKAGSIVRENLDRKYSYFVENNKDILFPIAGKDYNFVDCPINGLLVNTKTFYEIGDFTHNKYKEREFEASKILWYHEATNKGCKFKSIVGVKTV